MKRWMILVAVMLALVAIGVRAQDETEPGAWRLRTPTAEDYVENAGDISAAAETTYVADFYEDVSYNADASALMDEIDWRLVKNSAITYDQLHSIYQSYAARQKDRPYQPLTDYRWALELLKLWLDENPTNLSKTDELQFDEYTAQVMPLSSSFMANRGIWGYLFRIVETPHVVRYVGVQAEDGNITFPELPAPIDGNLLAWGQINGDEYPDIVYLNTTHMGNSYNAGDLIIASLKDERFDVISSLHYSEGAPFALPPESYAWQFIQLDDAPGFEVVQNQRLYDNWGCSFVQVTLFEWNNEGKLTATSQESLLPQSFDCFLVQAEKAMWKHQYEQAVSFYEQTLASNPVDDSKLMFAQIRLGLAYLFTGQENEAKAIFEKLIPSDDLFEQAVQQAYERDPRLLPMCQAMYNFVAENPNPNILSSTGRWKSYDGGFYGYDYPGFDLENASCDLPAVVEDFLAKTTFNTRESPVEQLEAAGLTVGDFIAEDFDQDGKQEWLVWLSSIGIDPLFFYPHGGVYQLSRLRGHGDIAFRSADLRLPDAYNQYSIITLPDGLGKALVDVDFSDDKYAIIQCNGCGGGPSYVCEERDPNLPNSPGDLTLWRVEDGELINFVFTPLCEMVTVEQLFLMAKDRDGLSGEIMFPLIPGMTM